MRPALLLSALLPLLPLRADVVHLTDGKSVEGEVKETPDAVEVSFANGGSLTLPRDRVASIERKPTPKQAFQERRKALASDDVEGRLALAEWAAKQGFEQAVANLAREVLALDPDHAKAQALLGKVRAGGTFLEAREALRRGFVPLEDGWGTPDQRYAEQEKALGLGPEALPDPALPSRTLTLLLHRIPPPAPEVAPAPAGKLEDLEGFLAWVPGGAEEPPCLVVLADAGEDLEAAYARWIGPAEAHRALLLCCPAPERIREGLDLLRARGQRVDANRIILAGGAAAWRLLEEGPGDFSAALLSGEPRPLPPEIGRVKTLEEALGYRRIPWPRRVQRRDVRAGQRHAWIRVDGVFPGNAPGFEAQVGVGNTIYLSTRHLSRLTLLLSDDLVDLSRPVTVVLNGRQAYRDRVRPDPERMLRSALEDRHRVVAAEIVLEIPP